MDYQCEYIGIDESVQDSFWNTSRDATRMYPGLPLRYLLALYHVSVSFSVSLSWHNGSIPLPLMHFVVTPLEELWWTIVNLIPFGTLPFETWFMAVLLGVLPLFACPFGTWLSPFSSDLMCSFCKGSFSFASCTDSIDLLLVSWTFCKENAKIKVINGYLICHWGVVRSNPRRPKVVFKPTHSDCVITLKVTHSLSNLGKILQFNSTLKSPHYI